VTRGIEYCTPAAKSKSSNVLITSIYRFSHKLLIDLWSVFKVLLQLIYGLNTLHLNSPSKPKARQLTLSGKATNNIKFNKDSLSVLSLPMWAKIIRDKKELKEPT